MDAEIVGETWENKAARVVLFRAKIGEDEYLCRITNLALLDDYGQPGDRDLLETFRDFQADILRRAERMLPPNPELVAGEPSVVIKRGNAMP